MIEINSFGVLGGDQRQASMAESMAIPCSVPVWSM